MDTSTIACKCKEYIHFKFSVFVILFLTIDFDMRVKQSLNDTAIQHVFNDIWVRFTLYSMQYKIDELGVLEHGL